MDTEDASDEPPIGAEEGETISQSAEDQWHENLAQVTAERDDLQAQLVKQQGEMQRQKEQYTQLWRMNCEQLDKFNKTLGDKDEQIRSLLEKIQQLEAGTHMPAAVVPPTVDLATAPSTKVPATNLARRGKHH